MYEHHRSKVLGLTPFIKRAMTNVIIAFCLLAVSLSIGMIGYAYFAQLDWASSFESASMILSGMGPVTSMPTTGGKVFAGLYALFSGIVFLIAMAIIAAPLFHRFLHHFLLKDVK